MNIQQAVAFSPEKRVLESPRIGRFEFKDDDLIILTSPIIGFQNLSEFLFISSQEFLPFSYFQSAEDANVTFIIAEIKPLFSDFNPKLTRADKKALEYCDNDELSFFGIVVVKDDPEKATINLKAPIVINNKKKLAKQVILDEDKYQIKTPLFR